MGSEVRRPGFSSLTLTSRKFYTSYTHLPAGRYHPL
jgi:hypothetical protein